MKIRPYAKKILKNLSKYYEICIFSAGSAAYVEKMVNELDPKRNYISYLLDRKHCLETQSGFFIKDLRIIENRKIEDILIIDNLSHSFGFQIDNGIPILSWTDDPNDVELKYLAEYLIQIIPYKNIQSVNRKKFNLAQLANINYNELF